MFGFLVILIKYFKNSRIIYYLDTIYLNKEILSYIVFYIYIFLFYFIYIIYMDDFEYCSNDDIIDRSNNNPSVNEGNDTRNENQTVVGHASNTTSAESDQRENLEENTNTLNSENNEVSVANQTRAQEIRSELCSLADTRLALLDRHDEI